MHLIAEDDLGARAIIYLCYYSALHNHRRDIYLRTKHMLSIK